MTTKNPTPPPRDRSRPFDVILWGATGFTGKLTAEYLAEHYAESDLRWAIAGRNADRLRTLQDDVLKRSGGRTKPEVLVGDSNDPASLKQITEQGSVVATTVGPYAIYGASMVGACVDTCTDYVDLTGEAQFVRRMIDTYQDRALEGGSRIVHCCGFDSIPSDLGCQAVQELALERHGTPCDRINLYVRALKGTASGGTIASMLNIMEEAKDPATRRLLGNPYSLNPEGMREGPDKVDAMGIGYSKDVAAWTAPFVMAGINTRVVRRSHALQGYPWGKDFGYSEVTSTGGGPRGLFRALKGSAGLMGFMFALGVPPARALLTQKLLPKPGEGPSRAAIEAGFFHIELVGGFRDRDDTVRVAVKASRDPGYGATAIMLGEAAVCLALDAAELTSDGGILTPSTAMGTRLRERLNEAGVTFRPA